MADPRRRIVTIGGVPVVEAPQEIDAATAESFQEILLRAASRQATVVVNMTGTRFCDSTGMRVLARAHERAVSAGGQLLLVIDATPIVLRVLALTGLDQLIPRFTDLHQALEQAHAVVPRPLQRHDEPAADIGLPATNLPAWPYVRCRQQARQQPRSLSCWAIPAWLSQTPWTT